MLFINICDLFGYLIYIDRYILLLLCIMLVYTYITTHYEMYNYY